VDRFPQLLVNEVERPVLSSCHGIEQPVQFGRDLLGRDLLGRDLLGRDVGR
jgi:hypothetical protein